MDYESSDEAICVDGQFQNIETEYTSQDELAHQFVAILQSKINVTPDVYLREAQGLPRFMYLNMLILAEAYTLLHRVQDDATELTELTELTDK